jgi:hypothetical protein
VTDFATSIDRLHNQIRHWEQSRWSAPAAAGTRADLVYALVQHLADLTADAEHRDRRPVPREPDVVLPDQLRVMSDDLLAASPDQPVLTEAATAANQTRQAL